MVLVAERGDGFCGIAGYYRDPARPDRAEVAFAVADAMQGRGLGTRLLERLAEIGRDRGLTAFDAYVLGDNLPMMDVFLQSGFAADAGARQGRLPRGARSRRRPRCWRRPRAAARRSPPPRRCGRSSSRAASRWSARTAQPGRIGSEIFRNLRESGFTGTLVPVHPSAETIGGIPA